MKGPFIEFCGAGCTKSGKTRLWTVIPKDGGGLLGEIAWYAPWRCYAFTPVSHTIFEQACLREIASFCERMTREQKATRKAAAN